MINHFNNCLISQQDSDPLDVYWDNPSIPPEADYGIGIVQAVDAQLVSEWRMFILSVTEPEEWWGNL